MNLFKVYVHAPGELGAAETADQDCVWAGEDGSCGSIEPIKSKPVSMKPVAVGKPLIITTVDSAKNTEDTEDGLFGFSYKQILIAGGVGVGLYLLTKAGGTTK